MADEWLSMTQARILTGLSRGRLLQLAHEGRIEVVKGSGKGWHKFSRSSLIRFMHEQSDTKVQVTDVVLKVQEIVTKARSAFEAEGLFAEYQALVNLLVILANK